MKPGKLQLGNEAIPVQYELSTTWANNKRKTTGKLILGLTPGPALALAITKMTGANLVTDDGQVLAVEFTKNSDGQMIEFGAIAPKGFVLKVT